MVRFDRFIASTAVGYRSLIKGLITTKLLLILMDYTVCILIAFLVKKVVYGVSAANELKWISYLFLVYTIWSFLLIPLIVYFKDKNTAMLTLVFGLSIFNIMLYESSLFLLIGICLIMFFLSIKVTEVLWKKGD